jgi:ferrous iron transport protein B
MMNFSGFPDSEIQKFGQQRSTVAQSDKERLAEIDAAQAEAGLRYSIAGRIGTALESLSWLAGFDWRTNISLVGGFAAKEIVVSTMGTAYSLGNVDSEHSDSLSETLAKSPEWSPLTAFSLIIFTMFYAPCFMSVVCIVKEAGSWKWGIFSMIFNTVLAFTLAVLVFQIGALIL